MFLLHLPLIRVFFLSSPLLHYPCSRSSALYYDYAVICVSREPLPTAFEFSVEFIQHNIAEQWGQISSLRSSDIRFFVSVAHHNTRFEILSYQTFRISVVDYSADITHQLVLRYIVKEFFKVDIYYPYISVIEVFKQLYDCLFTTSVRAKSVTAVAEYRFKYRR